MVLHSDDNIRMYQNCLHNRQSTHHTQQQQQQQQQLTRMNAVFNTSGGMGRTPMASSYYSYPSNGSGAPAAGDEAVSPGIRHSQTSYLVESRHPMSHHYYQPGVEYHPNPSASQSAIDCMSQQQQHGSPTGGGSLSWVYATSPDSGQTGSNDSGGGSPDWSGLGTRYSASASSFRGEENMDLMSSHAGVGSDRSPPGENTYTYLHGMNVDTHIQHNHHPLTSANNASAISPMHDNASLVGNGNTAAHHVNSAVRRQLQGDSIRSHNGSLTPSSVVGSATAEWGHTQPQQQHGAPFDWMKKQTYPAVTPSGKTRTKDKYRIVYTELQKVELEKEFLYNQYITIQRKAELAATIGLSDRQVKIWFQNRRAKERKHKRKREEVTCSSRGSSNGSANVIRGGSTGSSSSSSTAVAMQAVAKNPSSDSTSRLRSQLQLPQRCIDVVKMESVGPELLTSSIGQPSSIYTMN